PCGFPVVIDRLWKTTQIHCSDLTRHRRPAERIGLSTIVEPGPHELASDEGMLDDGDPRLPWLPADVRVAVRRTEPGLPRCLAGAARRLRIDVFAAENHQRGNSACTFSSSPLW